jgi:hypothetical protein
MVAVINRLFSAVPLTPNDVRLTAGKYPRMAHIVLAFASGEA